MLKQLAVIVASILFSSTVLAQEGGENKQAEQINPPAMQVEKKFDPKDVPNIALIGRWTGNWKNDDPNSSGGGAVIHLNSVDEIGIFSGNYHHYGAGSGSCLLFGRRSPDGKRLFFSAAFAPDEERSKKSCRNLGFILELPRVLNGGFVNANIKIWVSK